MGIFVNDEPYTPQGGPEQTVAQLSGEICRPGDEAGERMVVDVRCNGQAVPDDQLQNVLETPACEFDQLELQTQPVGALVRSTLDQAIDAFTKANDSRHPAADLLAEGRHEEAMAELQAFFEAWKQGQETIVLAAQSLRLDIENLRPNDVPITEIFEMVRTQLGELKDALESGDLVVVGDILRYELEDPCQLWLSLLEHLREQA